MAKIHVHAEGRVRAPADDVYRYIADMREHHPNFLPSAFSEFEVKAGGAGAGTVVSFRVSAGRRSRVYEMEVSEPDPGRVLMESDRSSSLVTTFSVLPDGGDSKVSIATEWDGAGGIGGIFERLFAPKVMQGIYREELERLDSYARQLAADAS